MPAITDSKCGNPLIFMQEGERNRVRLSVYLKRLSFVIRSETGFGSGGPLSAHQISLRFQLLAVGRHRLLLCLLLPSLSG
jgi:hypothetical protein